MSEPKEWLHAQIPKTVYDDIKARKEKAGFRTWADLLQPATLLYLNKVEKGEITIKVTELKGPEKAKPVPKPKAEPKAKTSAKPKAKGKKTKGKKVKASETTKANFGVPGEHTEEDIAEVSVEVKATGDTSELASIQ